MHEPEHSRCVHHDCAGNVLRVPNRMPALRLGEGERAIGRHAAHHRLRRRVHLEDLIEEEDVRGVREILQERLVERAGSSGQHERRVAAAARASNSFVPRITAVLAARGVVARTDAR